MIGSQKSMSLDKYLSRIDSVIPTNCKLLYIKPSSISFLKYLISDKNVDITVLDRNIKNIEAYSRHNICAIQGTVEEGLQNFGYKEFDYLICDNIIQNTLEPEHLIKQITSISKYSIVTISNESTLSKRIKFLLHGSIYNNHSEWLNGPIRSCNIQEFCQLCLNNHINIERAMCYDKSGLAYSMYDVTKLPHLFAQSIIFTLSLSDNTINNPITAINS